jgi:hypothetical protein
VRGREKHVTVVPDANRADPTLVAHESVAALLFDTLYPESSV